MKKVDRTMQRNEDIKYEKLIESLNELGHILDFRCFYYLFFDSKILNEGKITEKSRWGIDKYI